MVGEPEPTSTSARREVSRIIGFWTWVLALGGGALLVTATVDLVRGTGDGAILSLAFVGLALALGPLVFPRLYRFSVGVHGFSFELSREIAELKAPRTAELVDRQGAGLAAAAYAYAAAHTVLRRDGDGAARIRLQDHFVNTAAASALVQAYDRKEVQRLFRTGPPVVRVLVLGLMRGDPSLADAETVVSAITESRSANEQYHGLLLAKDVAPRLSADERRRLTHAVESDPQIRPETDRAQLRDEVLGALSRADGEPGDRDETPGGDDHTRATTASTS
jgi:hypothetical protein